MTSWSSTTTTTNPLERLSAKFGKKLDRAMKRDCDQTGPFSWSIAGNTSLNDAYDFYDVNYNPQRKRYVCSCRDHAYGQYRKFCGHIIRVIAYRAVDGDADPETWDDGEPDDADDSEQDHEDGLEDGPDLKAGVAGDGAVLPPPPPFTAAQPLPATPAPSSTTSPIIAPVLLPPPPPLPAQPPPPPSSPTPQVDDTELLRLLERSLYNRPNPSWLTDHRPGQWEAVVEIQAQFEAGKKVVFFSAPTGSGKTTVGDRILRLNGGGIYTCTTKTLQDQVEEDFPYADVLKGRSNYLPYDVERKANNPHIIEARGDLTAADCNRRRTDETCRGCPDGGDNWGSWGSDGGGASSNSPWHCTLCHPVGACSYLKAKTAALASQMGVINMSYLLTEANGPGQLSGQNIVVIDEADQLEQALMSYIEVAVPARWRKRLKIGNPEKVTKEESWIEWVDHEALPKVRKGVLKWAQKAKSGDLIDLRELKRLQQLEEDLKRIASREDRESPLADGWVYTGYEKAKKEGKGDDFDVRFKTVWVKDFAHQILWRHSERFLVMSATLVSAQQMAEELGLERDEWGYVEMSSTFPVERRPIFVQPVTRMVWDKEHQGIHPDSLKKMFDAVVERVERHPGQRILIHTVSYKLNSQLTKELKRRTGRPIATYYDASGRAEALHRLEQHPDTVLLAPSFERGVDLKGDLCEVTIIPKIPYASRGDKMVNARLYTRGGQQWYTVDTIRKLCQMTGRGMRSADDQNVTYILDGAFMKLWKDWAHILPEWWADALVFNENEPKWRGKLDWVRAGKEM